MPLLARGIISEEYSEVIDLLDELGLENGWVQEMGTSGDYLPDFAREGHPFDSAVGSPE
jgi:putative pyruvate formate lyase activating enzyme